MFIILPLIIIFLLYSYLVFNDTSLFVEIIIYSLILLVVIVSYLTYKKIKSDMKIQEKNSILLEIQEVENRMLQTDNKEQTIVLNKRKELLLKDLEKFNNLNS